MSDRRAWKGQPLKIALTVAMTAAALLGIGGLAGCSVGVPPYPPSGGSSAPQTAPGGLECRGSVQDPEPGDVICFTGVLDQPLNLTDGGTPDAPIVYTGGGSATVPGIRADADNIVIQGFTSSGADSTGIWASGTNITVQDNVITQVRYAGDDVDGIRFFGDGSKVLRNRVYDLEANDIEDSHVDCMQTFATSGPGSENVVIQGNRCEGIRAQCLMAEGPNDEGGSGEGISRNWLFENNYCDANAAAQSVALEDIQNVTIRGNHMVGKATKAFALGKGTTGTVVQDNKVGPGYGREVGFDDPSAEQGYQGPPAR